MPATIMSNCSLSQDDTVSVAESLSAMMHKEQTIYKSYNYLQPPFCSVNSITTTAIVVVTESDRTKLVDWCYSIVDKCGFHRETAVSAMEMVDRFLSSSNSNSKNANSNSKDTNNIARDILQDHVRFQLLAMAALYTSIKINEPVVLEASVFADMSRGTYSTNDIEEMELTILQGLYWHVCAPTSMQMADHILLLVKSHVTMEDSTWSLLFKEVRDQTEVSVRDYYFSTLRKSTVAMAAIFNAVDQVVEGSLDRKALLRALLVVLNLKKEGSLLLLFASPADLLAAKNRLQCLMSGYDQNDDDDDDDDVSDHPGSSSGSIDMDQEKYF